MENADQYRTDLTARARLAKRRLDAAVRRGVLQSSRARALAKRLQEHRGMHGGSQLPVLRGPYPNLTSLRRFLTDYGSQIDHICKPVVRRVAA